MKKKYLLLVLTFSLFTLIACGKKKELTIHFDTNPTTGYNWTYNISNSGVVSIEESYESDNKNEDIVGSAGVQLYNIKPLKEGTTTITFSYSRSWEDDSEIYNATYEITVDKNLNITENHSGSYFNK